jgi:hypothetical protein
VKGHGVKGHGVKGHGFSRAIRREIYKRAFSPWGVVLLALTPDPWPLTPDP